MNNREILAAVLRWSRAYEARRAIGAEKRRLDLALKAFSIDEQFSPNSACYEHASRLRIGASDAAKSLTLARRKEQAAMRALAKLCEHVREGQRTLEDASYGETNVPNATLDQTEKVPFVELPVRL